VRGTVAAAGMMAFARIPRSPYLFAMKMNGSTN
jgi:hypothetical protein